MVSPIASIARPWLSSEGLPASHSPATARKLRKRPVDSSNAVLEEAQIAPRAVGDGRPAEDASVEQVHLERPRDVVDAIAVGRIRPGALGVLHDPELARERLEVPPADPVHRGERDRVLRLVNHGWPPAREHGFRPGWVHSPLRMTR